MKTIEQYVAEQKQYQQALAALMSQGFTFMAAGRKLIEEQRRQQQQQKGRTA